MDATHLHLMITHALIFLAPVSAVLLIWGSNPLQKQMRRAGYVFALVAAVGGWGAHISGEEAEERIESLPWANHDVIHEHEEVAEITHFWVIALSVGALAGLLWGEKEGVGKPLRWVVVFLSVLTSFAGAYTANYGGRIRHTEIHPSGNETPSNPSNESARSATNPAEHEEHEGRD